MITYVGSVALVTAFCIVFAYCLTVLIKTLFGKDKKEQEKIKMKIREMILLIVMVLWIIFGVIIGVIYRLGNVNILFIWANIFGVLVAIAISFYFLQVEELKKEQEKEK